MLPYADAGTSGGLALHQGNRQEAGQKGDAGLTAGGTVISPMGA